jgi:hypothetical protein
MKPRRTLIFVNGSDGSIVDAWGSGIAGALDRGWNVLAFDGPGQNAALARQGIPFRPDWENVITPVVDYLCARPDVDAAKIAIQGVSQGGYWVPRAVAFEHRVAAAVADPGVIDVSTTVLSHLPHHMLKLLDAGQQSTFDRDMNVMAKLSPGLRPLLTLRMRPYGVTSPYEFFAASRDYALSDEMIARITCLMLVTSPEGESFWPGQSDTLIDKLTAPKRLVTFTESEGADGHVEPAALGIRGERILDWLDDQIPA